MKKLRVLREVLKKTGAFQLIAVYAAFFFLVALLIMLVEPDIHTYRDAVWYCYSVFSTAGFGDLVAVTFIGRILSALLTIYTLLIVGLVTGVVVAFYNDMVSMHYKASKAEILDELQHLETLDKEELAEISKKIRMLGDD